MLRDGVRLQATSPPAATCRRSPAPLLRAVGCDTRPTTAIAATRRRCRKHKSASSCDPPEDQAAIATAEAERVRQHVVEVHTEVIGEQPVRALRVLFFRIESPGGE